MFLARGSTDVCLKVGTAKCEIHRCTGNYRIVWGRVMSKEIARVLGGGGGHSTQMTGLQSPQLFLCHRAERTPCPVPGSGTL